jgi:meso-butanediol dehydrogenase / (S,S)-butanediol dehydrogenase / diacetyl reductase
VRRQRAARRRGRTGVGLDVAWRVGTARRRAAWHRRAFRAKRAAVKLDGRIALVTGAARGLGRAIALALAREGVDVAVSDIGHGQDPAVPYRLSSGDDLAGTVRAVEALGRRSAAITADVAAAPEVSRMTAEVERRFGGLDILIANAGIIAAGPVAQFDEAQWDRVFAVNVKGVFLTCRAAIPLLVRRGEGRIVNVASVAGKTGRGGLAAYCASKAAVISLTQALAEELGPHNVAVNALCPGYIHTAMWSKVLNPLLAAMSGIPEDQVFQQFVQRQTYLRREQTPEEIADGAVYLCRAENVTGTTLTVAGGGEVH